jgi:hypothetical protein
MSVLIVQRVPATRHQQVVGEMGAQGEPEVTVAELKGFPGEF